MSATRNGRTVLQRDRSRTASFQFSENGEHQSDGKHKQLMKLPNLVSFRRLKDTTFVNINEDL